MSALCLTLPLAMNLIRLLNTQVHDLMIFSCWLFYIFPILLSSSLQTEPLKPSFKISKALTALCAAFVLYSGIQTANAVYLKKELEFKACSSLMSEVTAEIENLPGYEAGTTPVMFLGYPSDALTPLEGFERINDITGVAYSNMVISYHEVYESYFKYILQKKINIILPDENAAGRHENLAAYPQKGYASFSDGAVVVKFK